MEFGKINDWSKIDFGLAKQPMFNQFVLSDEKSSLHQSRLYIGGTAWSEPKWKGNLYPLDSKPSDFLQFYGQHFNCVEANSTFYTLPSTDLLIKWKSQVQNSFKFCFKVPAWISRDSHLSIGTSKWQEFYESLALIEENIGILFMQLPETFDTTKVKVLESFLLRNNCPYPLAIEFRHKDWFKEKLDWLEMLNAFNITTVITDVAGRRDVCHMGLSTKNLIIRFVANESDEVIKTRVQNWGKQLKVWINEGAADMFFFIHQMEPLRINFTRNVILNEWHKIGLKSEPQNHLNRLNNQQTQIF